MKNRSTLSLALKISLWVGGVGLLLDPLVSLYTSKRLDDDGGNQLTICEIMYNNAQGRSSFAVFQTLFACAAMFSALRYLGNTRDALARWAITSLFIELFAYSTPYMQSPYRMHTLSLCVNYLNLLILNSVDVYYTTDVSYFRITSLSLAWVAAILIGIDSIGATNFTKQYHAYFFLEWIGLVGYVSVQLFFSRVMQKRRSTTRPLYKTGCNTFNSIFLPATY